MASQLFERYGEVLSGAFIALVGLGILDLARSLNDRGASKPTAAFALRHDGDNVAWSSGWILIRWCWGYCRERSMNRGVFCSGRKNGFETSGIMKRVNVNLIESHDHYRGYPDRG
jgi:hypothetical protein